MSCRELGRPSPQGWAALRRGDAPASSSSHSLRALEGRPFPGRQACCRELGRAEVFRAPAFGPVGCTLRSRTAVSCGNSTFNFFRKLKDHTVFPNGYTILHFYQQCTRVYVFANFHQYFCLCLFFLSGWETIVYCGFGLPFPSDRCG